MIRIELYGVLSERAGCGEVVLAIATPASVEGVLAQLAAAYPSLANDLPRVACAVGDSLVRRDEYVTNDAPLVLLPPVSGG